MIEQELVIREQLTDVEEFYVSRVNWLVNLGREDLIDPIADEFERHHYAADRRAS
jgi:hypothetical protein